MNAVYAAGQVIADRYRVERLLGEGGMGAVYLVEHVHMRKRYALKVLHPDVGENPEIVTRFEREALAAAHIDHPNVVAASDFGRTGEGGFYLVLEYVEGRSLAQVLESGPLSADHVLAITVQIGLALTRAHGLGMVHRDLKPENVMLVPREGESELVKVLDFGIAKVPVAHLTPGASSQALTQLGAVFGTPEYMAPEQAVGDAVDARADLYALGVMLYEMLTGVRPLVADDPMAMLAQHVIAPVPPMRERAPGSAVAPEVEAVVRKLLEKVAVDRYASAKEAVDALEQAVRGARTSRVDRAEATSTSSGTFRTADGSAATLLPDAGLHPPSPRTHPIIRSLRSNDGVRRAEAEAREAVRVLDEAAKPLLERALLRLPPRFAQLPKAALAAGVGLALSVPLVLFALVLRACLSGGHAESARGPEVGGSSPSSVASADRPKKPVVLDEARLASAKAEGPDALSALAIAFPEDARVPRAEVEVYRTLGKPLDALAALKRWTRRAPEAWKDPLVNETLDELTSGTPEVSDATFDLLEVELGAFGVDYLYARASSPSASPAKSRAQKSLAKGEVRGLASPALKVLFDFRDAKTCEAKHSLLDRVKVEADGRIVPLLKPYTYTKGCGFFGSSDCNKCMRADRKLGETLAALEARAQAKAGD
jgi:serine/threonine protein kinase